MARRPSFTELVDWLEGRLPDERAAQVEAAVAADDTDLQAATAWIRDFHHDSGLLLHQPVPAELGDRLRSVFRERQHPWDPTGYLQPDAVRDSRELPAASGFRASSGGRVVEARRVVVVRGEVQLVLDVTEHTTDGVTVSGSVIRSAPNASGAESGATVTFTGDGHVLRRMSCSEDGTFEALVPEGVDEVWVDAGDDSRFRAEVALTLR